MPSGKTLLEAIEAICDVDVDAVDPKVATALPFKAHNRKPFDRNRSAPTFMLCAALLTR